MTVFDPEAKYAALDERVANQGVRLTQIEHTMNTGFNNIQNSMSALATEMRASQKPNWQPVGIGVTVVIAVLSAFGAVVYLPIKTDQGRLETAIARVAEAAVPQKIFDAVLSANANRRDDLQKYSEARFARLEKDVDDVQRSLVPRGELEQRFTATGQREADIQRQTDETKRFQADIVSAKDFIKGLDERMRRIEETRARPPS